MNLRWPQSRGIAGLRASTVRLHRRREEAVRAMPVRPQPQEVRRSPPAARRAPSTFSLRQRLARPAAARTPACAAVNACGDRLVLRGEQAAGGVDQPPARLQQPRRAGRIARLLDAHLRDACGDWRHFRSGLRRSVPRPEHGASTSTRSILPASRLMRSSRSCAICRRMHVGQPAARQPRLQRVEPVRRGVERIEPPGVAHRRAERQRLAAGAGAEVDHHLAALGVEQQRQQLDALVLHLDLAAREGVELVAAPACPPGAGPRANTASARPRCRPLQRAPHVLALVLERVDAQVQRRRLVRGSRPAARTRRPSCAFSGSASHSGRLWRSRSGSVARSTASHCVQPVASRARSARARRNSRGPASRGSPGAARRWPLPDCARCSNSRLRRSTV